MDGRLSIIDQGSTNGTFVNGARVKQARLRHGDVVQVGATQIRVQAQTSDAAEPELDSSDTLQPALVRALLPHEQLALLQSTASRLSHVGTAEVGASIVLETMLQAVPADRACVFVRSGKDASEPPKVLGVQARPGAPSEQELPLEVVSRVFKTGRFVKHPPAPDEDEPRERFDDVREAVICAPLRSGGEVFGVVCLTAPTLPSWTHSREMTSFLTTMADLSAQAMGRARPAPGPAGRDWQIERNELSRLLDEVVQERTRVIEKQRIELAERLEELEHLQRSRSRLALGLVHDIQGLVSLVGTKVDAVRSALPETSPQRGAAEEAADAVERVLGMAEDVVAIAKFEDGNYPLFTAPLDPYVLAAEAVKSQMALARALGITLDLSSQALDLVVVADEGLFGRVLGNLVSSALRNAGRGGHVAVSTRRRGNRAEFVVSDSGPGVPKGDRERIFSEWYALEGSRRTHSIGLYFCRLAVRAHGGTIRIEGDSGDNRCVVTLPAVGEEYTGSHRVPR
jgi:signal transduction histidine kinase